MTTQAGARPDAPPGADAPSGSPGAEPAQAARAAGGTGPSDRPAGLGRNFWLLWAGQMVVGVGAGMTEFALGIWAARHTGSVSQYTGVVLCALLPGLLASPWLGRWVDRSDRRRLALWAEAGGGLCVLALWLSLRWGGLQLWEVYAVAAGLSVFGALQRLVLVTLVPRLVSQDQLLRAGGLMQLAGGLAPLVAPALAGLALAALQLSGVLAAHVVAVSLCLGLLAVMRLPVGAAAAGPVAPAATAGEDLRQAWRWLRARPPLLLLWAYTVCEAFTVSGVMLLLTPMVLAHHSEAVLGSLVFVAGLGLMVGSASAGLLRTPQRLVRTLLTVDLGLGVTVAMVGAAPGLPWLFGAVLLLNACFAWVSSAHQVIWQTHVPSALQGRVLALVQMGVTAATPLAALVGGLLADAWFEPLMQTGAPGAEWLGPWLGSGPGRGIALMFVLAGSAVSALAAGALLVPRLRDLDARPPPLQSASPAPSP